MTPGGQFAKIEENGRYSYAVNGRVWAETFEKLWEPIFSPDGKTILVRGVQDDAYVRRVVPLSELVS